MFIPFSKLSLDARIWIYQADKKLSETDQKIITEHLRAFTDQWLVHGAPVEASFDIRFDQFIILAANDPTSGCSIDASVRVMKDLGNSVSKDFFNRNLIAFKGKDDVLLIGMNDLKSELSAGSWNADSLVFNNVVTTLRETEKSWLVPASETWLKRYLIKAQSVQ